MEKTSKKERNERQQRLKKPKKSAVYKKRQYETAKNHAKVSSMRSIDFRARFDAMFTSVCITIIVILALILAVQISKSNKREITEPVFSSEAVLLEPKSRSTCSREDGKGQDGFI